MIQTLTLRSDALVDAILDSPQKDSIAVALELSLSAIRRRIKKQTLTPDQLGVICDYIGREPAEFATLSTNMSPAGVALENKKLRAENKALRAEAGAWVKKLSGDTEEPSSRMTTMAVDYEKIAGAIFLSTTFGAVATKAGMQQPTLKRKIAERRLTILDLQRVCSFLDRPISDFLVGTHPLEIEEDHAHFGG